MVEKFKSTGGIDAANQKLVNVADGDSAQDGVNIRVLEKKNTVQSHSTSRTYELGFIVEYNGQLWKCTTAVSNPGVFNASSWTALSGRENWIRLTANYPAGVMDSLYVDAASAITITLPATPKSGDYVVVIDGAGLASQRPITIARNGTTINGAASDVILNEDDVRCVFVYLGGTWKTLYTKVDRVKFTGSSAFTALSNLEYLIDVTANFTVTLPASPKVGDRICLVDYNGGLGGNTITVNGNSKQINGSANLLFSQKKGVLNLTYNGTQWVAVINAGADALLASKNLSDVSDKAAARTNLQLGTAAQQTMGTGSGEIRTNSQNDGVYQPKDATLTAFAALTIAADKLFYGTGSDQFGSIDFPALARTFLQSTNQAAQRSAMGLGDAATKNVGTGTSDVLGVGSFGVGGSSPVPTDVNTITKSGFYTVPAGLSNAPSMSLSTLLHLEADAAYGNGYQLAIDSNGVLYVRTRQSGTWSAWGTFATTGTFGTGAYRDVGIEVGDLIEVGAFGLGETNGLLADFNDQTVKTGFYRFDASTLNKPGSLTSGYVSIIWQTNSNFQQIAYSASNNTILRRVCYGNVFGSWGYIHTNLTIGPAIETTVGAMIGANGDQTKPMGVGAFGLGDDAPDTVITDCNAVTKNGWYVVSDTATNRPSSIAANLAGLFVITDGVSTRRTQIFTNATIGNSPAMWIRQFNGSVWTPWVEFAEDRVGEIVVSASTTAMPGTLKANGAAVSRTAYARLFAKIGTVFGAGDGSTTFNLPDLRGEFIRGWDDGRGVDVDRVFGSAQGDAIRNILGWGGSSVAYGYSGAFYPGTARSAVGAGGSSLNDAMFDASRVVPTASENRPRNVAMLYCIRY